MDNNNKAASKRSLAKKYREKKLRGRRMSNTSSHSTSEAAATASEETPLLPADSGSVQSTTETPKSVGDNDVPSSTTTTKVWGWEVSETGNVSKAGSGAGGGDIESSSSSPSTDAFVSSTRTISSSTSNSNSTNQGRCGPSPPTETAVVARGRFLLFVVALLYGSLSVSLRMVYSRPGPPDASILSATRGWMTVLCLFPLVLCRPCCRRKRPDSPDPPDHPESSFAGYCLELAIWNFGTQGLLNIGLKTTESARSAFFTQLSVVITPVLAATIGCCKRRPVRVSFRVWMACFLALLGLYVMTSQPESPAETEETEVSGFYHWIRGIGKDDDDDDNDFSWTWEYLSATTTKLVQSLSFGDWCCLGSALLWSLYIYRLSDWGNRYDEAQTMFVKNIFMALLYTSWTIGAYFWTTLHAVDADAAQGSTLSPTDAIANATINGTATTTADSGDESGFILWEGWRDPIALGILFYSALSSGAISDVLQQTAQSHVPAAESNVILSLEPVFAAVLGAALLQEIPSARECAGGACIVLASVLASG